MKFLALILSLPLIMFAMDISGAIDARLEKTSGQDIMFMLHGAEVNFRYTYANLTGDRLILAFQIPYSSDWKTDMFLYHYGDAYMIVKGALGKPNLKVGRFDIPFGLIKNFDSHTTLLPQLFDRGLGLKKDIGAQVFGYYRMLVYDLSFTQGFNRWDNPRNDHPIIARVGLDNDAIKLGISYYNSTHVMTGMGEMRRVGLDIEKNINPLILRGEAMLGDNPSGKGFNLMIDFPFFFGIEGRGSGSLWKDSETYQSYGIELRKEISFMTIGLGLLREKMTDTKTEAVLQTIIKI